MMTSDVKKTSFLLTKILPLLLLQCTWCPYQYMWMLWMPVDQHYFCLGEHLKPANKFQPANKFLLNSPSLSGKLHSVFRRRKILGFFKISSWDLQRFYQPRLVLQCNYKEYRQLNNNNNIYVNTSKYIDKMLCHGSLLLDAAVIFKRQNQRIPRNNTILSIPRFHNNCKNFSGGLI